MSWISGVGTAALVVLSASAGWLLHGLAQPEAPVAAATAPAEAPAKTSLLAFPALGSEQAQDEVQVHADGSASVRVSHRPPAWVLAELCRQGARELLGCGNRTAAAPVAPAAAPAPLLARLQDPSEQARLKALEQARDEGPPLPEATLLALMQSDPSDTVRLEAFDSYLESRSGSVAEMRAALQAVMRVANTALQTRAREQLDDLNSTEQAEGTMPQ